MEKLYKYLEKLGVNFKKQKWGNKYFFNVDPVIIPAASVNFKFLSVEDSEAERKIKTYCKRYNYSIFESWHNWNGYGMTITTPALFSAYIRYQTHAGNSAEEWEEMQHEYLTTGREDEIETTGRAIMEKHEKLYLESIA